MSEQNNGQRPQNDIQKILGELEGGTLIAKLQHMISEVALGQITHGSGNRKGKICLELTFAKVGENDQVMIQSKVDYKALTKRGAKGETASNETPMFVGKHGILSIEQPKEAFNGQFSLVQQN